MIPNTIDDLAEAVMQFNGLLPRPGIGPLYLSERYDLHEHWPDEYWPYSTLPGVYVVYGANHKLIYVGKASLSDDLGRRLGAHFAKSSTGSLQVPSGWEEARYVRTIPVPRDHAFEAPAIEEYLLGRLRTRANTQGQQGA